MPAPRKPFKRGGGPPSRPGRPGQRPPQQGRPRRPTPRQTSARERVLELIARQAARYPDLLVTEPETDGLDRRDGALAHAIYDIITRRWLTIEHIARRILRRPWEDSHPAFRATLLVGAAQILFLDRVPPHAAVSEAVDWAKEHGGLAASRAVNAVLRQFVDLAGERERRATWTDQLDELPLSDGTALVLTEPILPNDPIDRLAAATSHAPSLLRSWLRSMPLREVREVALHGIAHPPIILNTAHAQTPLPETAIPHTVPGHHVFTGNHEELLDTLSQRSDLWVQDPASSLAVGSVADLRPRVVIDPCAGLGTKTRQLQATFPNATIIASDVDRLRYATLSKVFIDSDQVRVLPYERLREHAGTADLILLDVPCSNTGVLARRPEARHRFDRERLESLTGVQRQIIADSIPLLASAGRILYSTCSLDAAENEEQAKWAARWHSLSISRESRRRPEGGPGQPPERYTDGAYSVLLA